MRRYICDICGKEVTFESGLQKLPAEFTSKSVREICKNCEKVVGPEYKRIEKLMVEAVREYLEMIYTAIQNNAVVEESLELDTDEQLTTRLARKMAAGRVRKTTPKPEDENPSWLKRAWRWFLCH